MLYWDQILSSCHMNTGLSLACCFGLYYEFIPPFGVDVLPPNPSLLNRILPLAFRSLVFLRGSKKLLYSECQLIFCSSLADGTFQSITSLPSHVLPEFPPAHGSNTFTCLGFWIIVRFFLLYFVVRFSSSCLTDCISPRDFIYTYCLLKAVQLWTEGRKWGKKANYFLLGLLLLLLKVSFSNRNWNPNFCTELCPSPL